MMELIQFPWSPFCLVQRRILEYSGTAFKMVDIPPSDRSLIWKLTRERYYQVPIVRDGKMVIFETEENSQVVAKYLDSKLQLGLFPPEWDGLQRIVWSYIEGEVEALTFKLNDAHFREFVPPDEQLPYLRHKERKFGRGCLDQWKANSRKLLDELAKKVIPFEQMLGQRRFLLDSQPRFVDFNLWGMLANFLFSGHYKLPAGTPELKKWHARMSAMKFGQLQ